MKQIVSSIDEAENARIMKGVVLDDLQQQLTSSTITSYPSSVQPHQSSSSSSHLVSPPSSSSSLVSSSSSKILVCPLDLLTRGIIGSEVSSLIHTLRIHKTSLETISDHLYHLYEKINNEVKKEINFLCSTTDSFLNASDISNDLIISNNKINKNSKSDVNVVVTVNGGGGGSGRNGNTRTNRNRTSSSISKGDNIHNDCNSNDNIVEKPPFDFKF